jgi:nucleotide-binding universal stress UspA family protein
MAAVPQVSRISLKNILFPTDFSDASEMALPFALALARLYGATLQIAHVILPEPHRPLVVDRLPAQDDRVWEDARRRLSWFTSDTNIADVHSTSLLASGDLAQVIPDLIHDHGIDLVVVGTHGRTGFSKMMMGSKAEQIYRSSPCPVLTIGPRVAASDWKPGKILCPVDPAENPEPALRYALSLAEENQAAILVMQSIPMVPWQQRSALAKQAWQRLQSLVPDQASDWCTPEFLIRWEHPAEAILATALEREVDLIVLGVRKARAAGLSSHLPWPVASEVVSRAPCPVLTFRI